MTRETIAAFIESLDVSRSVKDELLRITPETYTGVISFSESAQVDRLKLTTKAFRAPPRMVPQNRGFPSAALLG